MKDSDQRPLTPPSDTVRWNKSMPPGVNDVRNKVCWICREDEAAEANAPRRTWIHSCDCTLVAHESCLLTWIRLQDPSSTKPEAVKCPQCKTPFDIRTNEPKYLWLLEKLHRGVTQTARWSALVVLGGSALGLSAFYGHFAVRCFIGEEMADSILGGRHPRDWYPSAWINLPLLPFTLILTRFGFVPSLPSSILTLYALTPPAITWIDGQPTWANAIRDYSSYAYPPTPAVICVMWPFVQLAYRKAWRSIVARLVSAHSANQTTRAVNPEPQENGDADDAVVVEVEVAEAGDMRAALERGETITLTGGMLSRMFIGSLMLPPVSKLMGELLLRLSTRSEILQRVLGLRKELPGASTGLDWRVMARVITGGLGLFTSTVPERSYYDIDPVWWRNIIGLSMFIVGRDAFELWRRYLIVQKKQSRRVISKPFTHVDYNELDLIV